MRVCVNVADGVFVVDCVNSSVKDDDSVSEMLNDPVRLCVPPPKCFVSDCVVSSVIDDVTVIDMDCVSDVPLPPEDVSDGDGDIDIEDVMVSDDVTFTDFDTVTGTDRVCVESSLHDAVTVPNSYEKLCVALGVGTAVNVGVARSVPVSVTKEVFVIRDVGVGVGESVGCNENVIVADSVRVFVGPSVRVFVTRELIEMFCEKVLVTSLEPEAVPKETLSVKFRFWSVRLAEAVVEIVSDSVPDWSVADGILVGVPMVSEAVNEYSSERESVRETFWVLVSAADRVLVNV